MLSCIMKKQAPAYLSYLFTNLQAITAVGNRRCATSAGDIAPLHSRLVGFSPSDIPPEASSYSQGRAADDIACVFDHLAIPEAHIVGLSIGSFATLHFGFRHPRRAKSLCVGGCGYGAEPDQQEKFKDEADVVAAAIQAQGMNAFAERYAYGPTRVQFENKDPRGFLEFKRFSPDTTGSGPLRAARGPARAAVSLYPRRRDEIADNSHADLDR